MRKKFLIAAGVGVLLVVAQTAVAAIFGATDRNAAEPEAVTVAAAPVKAAVASEISAWDRMGPEAAPRIDDRIVQSQERTTTAPTPRQQAAAAQQGMRYEERTQIDVNTTVTENTKCMSGSMSSATMGPIGQTSCYTDTYMTPTATFTPYWVLVPVAAAAAVVVSDSGVSD